MNQLYYGDNLPVLREKIASESIDLIYLDPPFNSQRDYNVLFREPTGKQAASQIRAFDDTWHWTDQTELVFDELGQVAPPHLVALMNGLVDFVGKNDLSAYLMMLAIRLVELRRVLKPNGSLFLHCDPIAGHYIKVVLDSLFGRDKMISQFTWVRTGPKGLSTKRPSNNADFIFWFAKGEDWVYNPQYTQYSEDYLKTAYRHVEEGTGRRYRLSDVTNPNKNRPNLEYEWKGVKRVWRWTPEKMAAMEAAGRLIYSPNGIPSYKRYLDEMQGAAVPTVWQDIKPLQGSSREYLGYPTQKPVALLKRIVNMASHEGDVILDPFCGCGTSIHAAQELGREWIGIDVTFQAIKLIRQRMTDTFSDPNYAVIGVPNSFADAQTLAQHSRREFELWAIAQIGARPSQERAGADAGIDGVMFFRDDLSKKQAKIIVQVKSGKTGVKDIRDLRGTLEREKAAMGIFITLEAPTAPMKTEAASAGLFKTQLLGVDYKYPALQIVHVPALFEANPAQLPLGASDALKAAQRLKLKPENLTANMFDEDEFDDD